MVVPVHGHLQQVVQVVLQLFLDESKKVSAPLLEWRLWLQEEPYPATGDLPLPVQLVLASSGQDGHLSLLVPRPSRPRVASITTAGSSWDSGAA